MTCVGVKDDYSEGCGAMDKTGKFIIPPIYGNLFEEHGVFGVSNEEDDFWGIVDKNNQVLIPMKYGEFPPQHIKEDLWIVEDYGNKKFGVINLNNETILPFEYDLLITWGEITQGRNSSFTKNELYAEKGGKWGVITFEGKTVLPFIYNKTYCFPHNTKEVEQ